jgi:RimJ/RimL family protein N-acetyltransferase
MPQASFVEAPPLSDGVVLLDSFQLPDVEAQLAGDDAENQKWLNDSLASTIETVTRAICDWRRDWQTGAARRTWALRDPATHALMGGCEVRVKEDEIAHVSYWVFPQHRGRGFAPRALQLVVAFAFEHLGVERAEAYVDVENVASRAVARKAGFIEEGVLRKLGTRGNRRVDLVITSKLIGE